MKRTVPNDLSSDPGEVMSAAGPAARRSVEVEPVSGDPAVHDAAPLSPQAPERMHRSEDDARARVTSPDFSDHPAHVVTDRTAAPQADRDQGADVTATQGDGRPPAGGGSAGDR